MFAPDALRDLAPSEKLGAEPAMYVKLEGLGKIAYSNIRRPRPLMDLVAEPLDAEPGTKVRHRPPAPPPRGGRKPLILTVPFKT